MNCPKCNSQIGEFSILCPKCHERIPGRHLHDVAKNTLYQGRPKPHDGVSNDEKPNHMMHVFIGIMMVLVAGIIVFKIGGPVVKNFMTSSTNRMTVAKENLEQVCKEGFRQFSAQADGDYNNFEQQIDQYARNHGLVDRQMFFMMCGQFAGQLAEEVFNQRIDYKK